jgi:hypothetical protein
MSYKRAMNNTEFVEYLMTIGGITGSLKQMFIIEAIAHYAADIIEDEAVIIAQEDEDMKNGKRGLINMRAWVRCANELQDLIAKRSELPKVKIEDECDATESDIY